ncbi:MAG: TolC family protein [Thermocrinis sp.]|nr:TolC family protein [Thermocrinis sp.]
MRILWAFAFTVSFGWAVELSVSDVLQKALENNKEIKAMQKEISAGRLELKSARGAYFPRIKFEENFTRTDIPVYAFMTRLNQERITQQDFDPSKLNHPSAINNFETKIGLEIPIWLGGKIQAGERLAKLNLSILQREDIRKKEDVALKVYEAYGDAVLAKMAVDVSKQALESAQEHQRLAEETHKVGMALLSDIFRAKVYVEKARERLFASQKDYETAKKALELVVGTSLGDFDVVDIKECPAVELKGLKETALQKREDLKAMYERAKLFDEFYTFELSNNLPQVYAGAFYSLNSKDGPFGTDGKGYMLMFGISWSFDTGLTTLNKARAYLERKKAIEERIKGMKDLISFEVDRAKADYEKALSTLNSARERIKASEEVLRVMRARYRNGLARIVDVLDAQTELDIAKLEEVKALVDCWKAYARLKHSVGTILEEVQK